MRHSDDATLVVLAASSIALTAGYATGVAGLPIAPWFIAVAAIAALVPAAWTSPGRPLPSRAVTWVSVLAGSPVLVYALMMAPEALPVTNGPDVVHHLQLIHAIEATGRLPHDASQQVYLLEMMNYTPGSHILAYAVSAWLRVDPLFVVFWTAMVATLGTATLLYELARRLLGSTPRSVAQAFAAPILALAPVYFFGAFIQFFFFAQVVSQTFAVGMLLALVCWQASSQRWYLWMAAACGAGVVLSWPVWIVPASVAAAVAVLPGAKTWRARFTALAIVLGPALLFGAVHQALHRGAESILASSGAVTEPSVAAFGIGFLVVAAAGLAIAAREPLARPVVAFLAATLLFSALLALLARGEGPGRFYMAFKMMYLAILPAAVLGGVALARGADLVAARAPFRGRSVAVLAAILPLLVAALVVRGRLSLRPPHASLTVAAHEVGLWARDRVPPGCVDYFTKYWLTGYWLHLDVLGNPRLSDRMREETFDFPDVAAKWIQGRGLPYAIVEDMSAIPREIRPEMEPLHRSGSFVLVRNARGVACPAR